MTDERILEYLRSRSRVEPPGDLIGSVADVVAEAPQRRGVSWFALAPALAAAAALVAVLVVAVMPMDRMPRYGPLPVPPSGSELPTPTPLEQSGTVIDVAWDNRSDESFAITLSVNGEITAWAEVEPCSAHNLIVEASGPFSIGLGQRVDGSPPGGEPVIWSDIARESYDSAADPGQNELLVVIHANGAVSVVPRSGPATVIPSGNCEPAVHPAGALLEPGDQVELPAVDENGQFGTILVERGQDRAGYAEVAKTPGTFVIELFVQYTVDQLPEAEQFGRHDWALRPTDPDAENFFLIEAIDPVDGRGDSGPPQPRLGIYPGPEGEDVTLTEGWMAFEVSRREADLELELVYLPGDLYRTPAVFTVRAPGPPPAVVERSPAPGDPIYVAREGLPITVAQSAAADALFENLDTCSNPNAGYTVAFPDDWYTNTAVDGASACSWFTPEFFEVTDAGEVPPEVWLTIESGHGDIGYLGTTEVYLHEDLTIDGRAAQRVEFNPNPTGDPGHRIYHYVVPFGPDGGAGGTVIVSTDSDRADDYELARAVLDRLMASLEFD